MTREISNSADIIDSRDIIARIEELSAIRDSWREAADAVYQAQIALDAIPTDASESDREAAESTLQEAKFAMGGAESDFDDDVRAELAALESLAEEASDYADDWHYGVALIRDSYFEDYAREFADDIGATDRDAKWPNNHIDWEAAADELRQDYTSVEFYGVTYWVR